MPNFSKDTFLNARRRLIYQATPYKNKGQILVDITCKAFFLRGIQKLQIEHLMRLYQATPYKNKRQILVDITCKAFFLRGIQKLQKEHLARLTNCARAREQRTTSSFFYHHFLGVVCVHFHGRNLDVRGFARTNLPEIICKHQYHRRMRQ